jgi:hypothetical protein
MLNKSNTQFCIEILQINKYYKIKILLHNTIHYRDNILHKYHMHDTLYDTAHYDRF